MAKKAFEPGDRVAHSARVAFQHGSKSVATWASVLAQDPDAFKGAVVDAANEVGTVFTVKVDEGADGGRCAGEQREFTADSLVRIEE